MSVYIHDTPDQLRLEVKGIFDAASLKELVSLLPNLNLTAKGRPVVLDLNKADSPDVVEPRIVAEANVHGVTFQLVSAGKRASRSALNWLARLLAVQQLQFLRH